MGVSKIEHALVKIEAAADYYDELSKKSVSDEAEEENNALKMRYAREQLLKLTLEIKEAARDIEKEIEKEI